MATFWKELRRESNPLQAKDCESRRTACRTVIGDLQSFCQFRSSRYLGCCNVKHTYNPWLMLFPPCIIGSRSASEHTLPGNECRATCRKAHSFNRPSIAPDLPSNKILLDPSNEWIIPPKASSYKPCPAHAKLSPLLWPKHHLYIVSNETHIFSLLKHEGRPTSW